MNMNLPFTHLIPRVFNPQHETMLKFTQCFRHTRRFEHAWNLNLKSTPGVQGRTSTRKASFSGETYFKRKPDRHRPLPPGESLCKTWFRVTPPKTKSNETRSLPLLQTPDPLILLPGPVLGRKHMKIPCWWRPYQQHSLVLPPAPGLLILGPAPGENTVLFPASAKHSLQGLYPAARSRTFEKAKENTVFVLALWFHAACTNTFGPSWIASDHDLS